MKKGREVSCKPLYNLAGGPQADKVSMIPCRVIPGGVAKCFTLKLGKVKSLVALAMRGISLKFEGRICQLNNFLSIK